MAAPKSGTALGDTWDSSLAGGQTRGAASGAAGHGQQQQWAASWDVAAGFQATSSANEGTEGEVMRLGRRLVRQSSGASLIRGGMEHAAQPGTMEAAGKSFLGPSSSATA